MVTKTAAASVEYRVVWKREGLNPKRKRYATRKAAERLMTLLEGLEPWKVLGKNPDAYVCCPGTEQYACGCGGLTVREEAEQYAKEAPKLEWARIESREVGEWRAPDTEPPGNPSR